MIMPAPNVKILLSAIGNNLSWESICQSAIMLEIYSDFGHKTEIWAIEESCRGCYLYLLPL